MNKNELHAVTGAFGYSGRYIATRLLEQGRTVITLTNSVEPPESFWRPRPRGSAFVWRAGQTGGGAGRRGRLV